MDLYKNFTILISLAAMGFRRNLALLLLISYLSIQSKADGGGSVFFLDSAAHRYINPATSENDRVSVLEVGAAVSVLLGFAPPATISAASSSKLNKVLKPNPFDRPRAIFMLDVRGAGEFGIMMSSAKGLFGSAHKSMVIVDSEKADIQLPDGNEVSVISLNELSGSDSHAEFGDKELSQFASWLGEPYVTNALEPLNGKLTVSLPSGSQLTLDVSKESDKLFLENLASLMHNIRKAMDLHQDLSRSIHNPAELVTGSFDGIKVLQEEYGTGVVSQLGLELLSITISKLFDTLQAAYKGQIVGVILLNETPSPESERLLNIMYTSRPSARWLEETQGSSDITKAVEVLLVRRTLAWTTGILLLIATLLGTYFLLYMPITKDTLLYSNVKLD